MQHCTTLPPFSDALSLMLFGVHTHSNTADTGLFGLPLIAHFQPSHCHSRPAVLLVEFLATGIYCKHLLASPKSILGWGVGGEAGVQPGLALPYVDHDI